MYKIHIFNHSVLLSDVSDTNGYRWIQTDIDGYEWI